MCNLLYRLDKTWGTRSNKFNIVNEKGKEEIVEFKGCIKEAELSNMLKQGWVRGDLYASKYTLGYGFKEHSYEVPNGYTIRCIINKINNKKKSIYCALAFFYLSYCFLFEFLA